MESSSKLVFFGTEDFSNISLIRLIKEGWNIVAVVTKPDSPSGRGQELKQPLVKQTAKEANVKVFQPDKVLDIKVELAALGSSHGILVSYGKILPQEIIDIFPDGIINVHPSLLPKYRGPSPIEVAILNGDSETGVSLMKLTIGMDEGPVYAQKVVKIPPSVDKRVLYEHLAQVGADFLAEKLPMIIDSSLTPQSQDDSKTSYTKLLKKEDGIVDWQKPAEVIERQVRAFAGWPKSQAKILDQGVIITKSRAAKDQNDGDLVMKCNPGYLEIEKLIAPSGRSMSGADFLRGYSKPS
ncbi:MAG TPA: methionyl-tRNA formyltransferase [Candidatus Saccharimonadales bacterium]|nr:methionyl-tRNA formyltransferase [Candidatus Saccharimonadales bacterium]